MHRFVVNWIDTKSAIAKINIAFQKTFSFGLEMARLHGGTLLQPRVPIPSSPVTVADLQIVVKLKPTHRKNLFYK